MRTEATQQVAVLADDFADFTESSVRHLLTAVLEREDFAALLVNADGQDDDVDAVLDADESTVGDRGNDGHGWQGGRAA